MRAMKETCKTPQMLLLGASIALAATAAGADLTIKDITWGEHWSGTKVDSARDLKGKVVLLKIWGG